MSGGYLGSNDEEQTASFIIPAVSLSRMRTLLRERTGGGHVDAFFASGSVAAGGQADFDAAVATMLDAAWFGGDAPSVSF